MPKPVQGSVRIIAGQWRRRRLPVPDRPGLRPTPDRVRETLFNWLARELVDARCLDLFAGTGALGFEAASRGARAVTMVESDVVLAANLEQNCRVLGATTVAVVRAEAQGWLRRPTDPFDIVFLDPPFDRYDLHELCESLQLYGHLNPWSRIYLESDARSDRPRYPEHWNLLRSGRAARVRYDLLTPTLTGDPVR